MTLNLLTETRCYLEISTSIISENSHLSISIRISECLALFIRIIKNYQFNILVVEMKEVSLFN